jgi:hypothetical protein
MKNGLLIALFLVGLAGWLHGRDVAAPGQRVAEEKEGDPKTSEALSDQPQAPPPLKQIGPGEFQVGKVRFSAKERKVRFPAFINMEAGLVEYLIVTGTGKLHESLLWTEVEPYHIHVAMLFLGAKVSTPADPLMKPEPFTGEKVTVEFTWKEGDTEKRSPIERFVTDLSTRKPIDRGPWVYNGSRVINGTFLAQRDGSIVSLIEDPDALMNNSRTAEEDDENWTIRKEGLPPAGSPVEVVVSLPEPKKTEPVKE